MVVPLIVGSLAVSAISGIMQWQNSEAARKASAAERQRMENLLSKIQAPNFDMSQLTPEEYQVAGKYVPQAASFIEEVNPQLVKADSADAKLGRQAQKSALAELMGLAQGDDLQSKIEMQRAREASASGFRGTQGSILENARHRGVAGSGMELASQLSASQGAYNASANASQNSAMESVRRRLEALRQGADIGGQIRNEDVNLESRNNDVINQFNQRTAARKQSWGDNSASIANEGQRVNLTNEQDIANKNTSTRNTFQSQERNRQDDLLQKTYDNEMSKMNVRSGIANMGRSDAMNAGRDQNSAISGMADGGNTALAYYLKYGNQSQNPTPKSAAEATGMVVSEDEDEKLKKLNYGNNRYA